MTFRPFLVLAPLVISFLRDLQGQQVSSTGHAGVATDDAKTVCNVSFQASESEIWDSFSQAGQVTKVCRQTDDPGQSLLVFNLATFAVIALNGYR